MEEREDKEKKEINYEVCTFAFLVVFFFTFQTCLVQNYWYCCYVIEDAKGALSYHNSSR